MIPRCSYWENSKMSRLKLTYGNQKDYQKWEDRKWNLKQKVKKKPCKLKTENKDL